MSATALDLLARSTLLLLLVAACAWAVRMAGGSAAMRHAIWHLGFAGLAALPLLAWVLPPLSIAILPAAPTPAPVMPGGDVEAVSAVAASGGRALDLAVIAAALYAAIALVVLGLHLLGRILIERLWRGSDPAGANALALLDGLRTRLGLRRRVALRIAQRQLVPMTWGSLRPRILLPADAHEWSAERLRAVLLHELGHVARLDGPARLLADGVCAAYWIHPGVWMAARHMRLAQEQACDDFVLASERDGPAYARILLDCAGSIRPGAAMAMAGRTDLERRLRAILGNVPRRRAGPAFVIAGATGMIATTALAAMVVPVPSATATPAALHRRPVDVAVASNALAPIPANLPRTPAAIEQFDRTAIPATGPVPRPPAAAPSIPLATSMPSTADMQYRQRLEDYRAARDAFMIRMAEHRAAKAKYRSDYAEYRRRMAEHWADPWTPAPVPPVAPVEPPAPPVPVAPPVPPTPPTPPDTTPHA